MKLTQLGWALARTAIALALLAAAIALSACGGSTSEDEADSRQAVPKNPTPEHAQ